MGGLRSCEVVVPGDSVDLLVNRVLSLREEVVWLVRVSKGEGAPDRSREEDWWLREPCVVVVVREVWYRSGMEGSFDPKLAAGVAIVFCVVESAPSDHQCRLS